MLISKPTKKAAGIEIYGDYRDLESLHETIHHLCEDSILVDHMEDYLLGLAYEIRHAYQGDRLKRNFGNKGRDGVQYFGTQLLWPQFLVQLSLLRHAAGSKPTNHEHQANLYRFEHITLDALVQIDPKIAGIIFPMLPGLSIINSTNYLFQFIDSLTLEYVTEFKSKRARINELPEIMRALSPMSEDYELFEKTMMIQAKEHGCSPLELTDTEEWPEFDW